MFQKNNCLVGSKYYSIYTICCDKIYQYMTSTQVLVGRPPKSWSEYTTAQQARAGQNMQPMTKSEKLMCKLEC